MASEIKLLRPWPGGGLSGIPDGAEEECERRSVIEQGLGGARRSGDGAIPDGARPVGDERLHQCTGQGLPHHGDHDSGGHHPLLLGHGHAHPHWGEDRRHDRSSPGVRDRPYHLRLRVGADCRLAVGGGSRARVVAARRHRRRPGPPRTRRLDRGQLRGLPSQGRLRDHRGSRRGRDRRRPDPGRMGYHRGDLADRLCRRGDHRGLHLGDDPQGWRRCHVQIPLPSWTWSARCSRLPV